MSSHCRTEHDRVTRIAAAALLCALVLTACNRERREFAGKPRAESGPEAAQLDPLTPGGDKPFVADPRGAMYEGNAYHITQGGRLFRWYNCTGCHAAGGGAIGPALMDDTWRYGGRIDQIYSSIVQGRPNGMPSFRDKVPSQQVWQLAAYVRALSGNVPKDAAPSRRDAMAATPPLTRVPKQPPRTAEPPVAPP
jgi:cytochrome c oxidase cbb3-type subunit 3